jgi:Zn-finger nucleic acid-binding protein
MNCPNCGAPLKYLQDKPYFFCDYCSSYYFPEESKDGVRMMNEPSSFSCPVCKIPLVEAFIDETPVLSCSNCQGILIKQVNFISLINSLRSRRSNSAIPLKPMNPEELKRQSDCPGCGKRMATHPYGGPGNIVIDNCPSCHIIWLDYGEMYKVINSADREFIIDEKILKYL